MKKTILLAIMMAMLTAKVSAASYLTFETTEGAKVSVATESLTLTISGTTLTAGSQSFEISNLSKMYFSTSDETTGIERVQISTIDYSTDIYDMQGHKVDKEQMRKGVYIVKSDKGTYKIAVK